MINKLKINKFIILLVVIFALIYSIVQYNQELIVPEANYLKPSLSRYELEPTLLLDFSNEQLGYPYVSRKPGTISYLLLDYVEKYQIYTNQKDRLFFANKRVSEIEKWGDDFKIVGGVDSLVQLEEGSYPQDSWEYALSNYHGLMMEAIEIANTVNDEFADNSDLIETQKYIVVHERDLKDLIEEFDIENDYILSLIDIVFMDLKMQLGILPLDDSDMEVRHYNTNIIKLNRDSGTYDVLLNKDQIWEDLMFETTPILEVSDSTINPITIESYYIYEDILLNDEVDEVNLVFNLQNRIDSYSRVNNLPKYCNNVFEEYDNNFQYYRLSTQDLSGHYLLNIQFDQEINISEVLIISDDNNDCTIRSRKVVTKESASEVNVNLFANYENTGLHYLAFDTENNVNIASLLLGREIYPTIIFQKQHTNWMPEIQTAQIDRGKYEVRLDNANRYQINQLKSNINFPYKVTSETYYEESGYIVEVNNRFNLKLVGFMLIVFTTVSLIRKRFWIFINDKSKRLFSELNSLSDWLRRYDKTKVLLVFVLITLVISVVDIFYISSTIDPIFITPIMILFVISLVYGLESKFLIVPGLAYFVLSVIMYMLDIGNYIGGPVDKATYWSYYLLLFGTLLMVIRGIKYHLFVDK